MTNKADIGLIGLAVMGQNLALNMNDHGFTVAVYNRTVSKTNVTREVKLAVEAFDFTESELRNSIIYGFKRSFFPGTYKEKRIYVRKIINYYEKLQKEYGRI